MSKKILIELKKHQKTRSDENPFESNNAFLEWSDSVAPLLNFDETIKNRFSQTLLSAKVTERMSPKDHINNVNECVGIVNEAIQQLEHNITPKNKSIKSTKTAPSNFQDLFFKSNFNTILIILGILISTFSAGVTLGQSKLYSEHIAPLLKALEQTTND